MRYLLPSILALLTLVACDTTASLSALRRETPPDNPYDHALMRQYQKLAERELTNYDWWSSQRFADKGLLAARGKDIAPEDPSALDLSHSDEKTLVGARDQLLAALTPKNKAERPQLSATLIVSYDCWVENMEEGWNTPAINACRQRFDRALTLLKKENDTALARAEDVSAALILPPVTAVADQVTGDATDAPLAAVTLAPEEVPAPTAPPPIETSSSIFYFPFDNDALTGEALTSLQNLIIDITNHKPTQIVINGHADRAGTDEYNISLSERRARFILDQLLAAGIDPGMVSYHAFGERSPQVTTANGTAEQANRRAEIFIE